MGQFFAVFLTFAWSAAIVLADQQIPLIDRQRSRNYLDKDFDNLVAEVLEKYHVLGLSVSIVDKNETYAKGYGIAELPDVPAKPETLYYTGSTTKSFTTAALLQLMEQDAESPDPLKLSTPISSVIRDDFVLPDEYTTLHVTFEDALSHRTGMPRHDFSYGGPKFSVRDLVRSLRNLPLSAELRATFQYCNLMFVVVGHVIETLTDRWLGDVLKERIWSPLGMHSTFFAIKDAKEAEAKGGAPLSVPYSYLNETGTHNRSQYLDDACVSGAGAVISNVIDYATYLRAMMYMNSTLLSEGSFKELRTPRTFENPRPDSGLAPVMYSLGWEMAVYRGVETFYHGGSVIGYGTMMLYIPQLEWGFAMMSNTDLDSGLAEIVLRYELLDRLLDTPKNERLDWDREAHRALSKMWSEYEDARKRLYPNAPEKEKALPHTLPLKDYAGSYFNAGYRSLTLTLGESTEEAGTQILRAEVRNVTWAHDIEFEHVSEDYFLARILTAPENPSSEFNKRAAYKAEFRIGEDGTVAALGIGYEEMLKELIWYDKTG